MPARKPRPKDEKPQFERFVETARKVEAGETDEVLERIMAPVAQAPTADIKDIAASRPGRSGKRRGA
jgi:hypothetical protein